MHDYPPRLIFLGYEADRLIALFGVKLERNKTPTDREHSYRLFQSFHPNPKPLPHLVLRALVLRVAEQMPPGQCRTLAMSLFGPLSVQENRINNDNMFFFRRYLLNNELDGFFHAMQENVMDHHRGAVWTLITRCWSYLAQIKDVFQAELVLNANNEPEESTIFMNLVRELGYVSLELKPREHDRLRANHPREYTGYIFVVTNGITPAEVDATPRHLRVHNPAAKIYFMDVHHRAFLLLISVVLCARREILPVNPLFVKLNAFLRHSNMI